MVGGGGVGGGGGEIAERVTGVESNFDYENDDEDYVSVLDSIFFGARRKLLYLTFGCEMSCYAGSECKSGLDHSTPLTGKPYLDVYIPQYPLEDSGTEGNEGNGG